MEGGLAHPPTNVVIRWRTVTRMCGGGRAGGGAACRAERPGMVRVVGGGLAGGAENHKFGHYAVRSSHFVEKMYSFFKDKYFDYLDTEEFIAENGSKILVKYSVSNKKFRENAVGKGNLLNSFVGKLDGVSIVRNGRELEIDKSFMTKDTRERFIGVEVSFDATLDDLMGVDGKKQTAANFYKREVEEAVTVLTKAMEPAVIFVVAAIVGTIAVSYTHLTLPTNREV